MNVIVGQNRKPEYEAFAELAVVKATAAIRGYGGIVPSGSTGTVVTIHSDGEAYEVEFDLLEPTVVCARREDLELA